MRYDLIKADLLIQLAKSIHEYKGSNATAIYQQYNQLAFKASEKAFDILAIPEDNAK